MIFDLSVFDKLENENLEEYKIRICTEREKLKDPITKKIPKEYRALTSWVMFSAEINKQYSVFYKPESIRSFWKNYRKTHNMMDREIKGNKTVVETKADGSHHHSVEGFAIDNPNKLKDEKFLLELHGYETDGTWVIQTSKSSQWEMLQKGGGAKKLYSSSIVVRKVVELNSLTVEEIMLMGKDRLCDSGNKKFHTIEKLKEGKKVLLLEPVDLHIGKTEYITLDDQLAQIIRAYSDAVDNINMKQIQHVCLTIGNDFYNCDSVVPQSNTPKTQKGTILSSNNNFSDMYLGGVDVAKFMVDDLLTRNDECTIELVYVPANHDRILSFTLSTLLKEHYDKNDRVSVDNIFEKTRKYRRFGNFGVGLCHGEKDKNKLPELFSLEVPEIWAFTKFREIHAAHFHTEQARDELGVLVRRISSLSPEDTWSEENGYKGGTKRITAFVIDDTKGIKTITYGY